MYYYPRPVVIGQGNLYSEYIHNRSYDKYKKQGKRSYAKTQKEMKGQFANYRKKIINKFVDEEAKKLREENRRLKKEYNDYIRQVVSRGHAPAWYWKMNQL